MDRLLGIIGIGVMAFLALKIVFSPAKWFMQGYRGEVPGAKSSSRVKENTSANEEQYLENSKLRIIETQTTYEVLGNEERIIDNSKSDGLVKRKLTISREWKRVISLDQIDNTSIKGKIGIPFIAFEAELEKMLQSRYGVSIEETKVFSEELELEIAPHSKIVLNIVWKNIWQHGELEYVTEKGIRINVPFRVAKGVIFDQIQEKVN